MFAARTLARASSIAVHWKITFAASKTDIFAATDETNRLLLFV